MCHTYKVENNSHHLSNLQIVCRIKVERMIKTLPYLILCCTYKVEQLSLPLDSQVACRIRVEGTIIETSPYFVGMRGY